MHTPEVFIAIGVTPARQLKLARTALGLTQRQVAHLARVSPCEVSSAERGFRVYPAALSRIRAALGLQDDTE